MKKLTAFLCVLILISTVLCGCAGSAESSKGLKIVATTLPVYDWVENITSGANECELSLLNDSGVDMHSFQPSAQDIVNISSCDVFVYVGGESDQWVDDALKDKVNKDMTVINLMDLLKDRLKNEELKEGMQGEADQAPDEHIWLSLKNAQESCKAICVQLAKLDKKNAKTYQSNCDSYNDKLEKLDNEYVKAVSAAKQKTLVVADRFPFRYLTDDYGLDYYAAFSGCSAETEASFKTIVFLAKKVDELKLTSIFKIDGSDGKVAETVIENTKDKNARVLTLDSMQSSDSKSGSYLAAMRSNLETLKTAFKE